MAVKKRPSKDERQKRLRQILLMREDERSMDYIGRKLGITKQRVFTILKIHERKMAAEKQENKS